jgi:hypothetical protein
MFVELRGAASEQHGHGNQQQHLLHFWFLLLVVMSCGFSIFWWPIIITHLHLSIKKRRKALNRLQRGGVQRGGEAARGAPPI